MAPRAHNLVRWTSPDRRARGQEQIISELAPARPPLSIRVAVIGLGVLVALMVLDLIGVMIGGAFNATIVIDVVLAAVFVTLAVAVRQGRSWSRWTAVVFCGLLLLTTIAQLTQALPPIVLAVAGLQFIVLAAVAGCLIASSSRWWFRSPERY